ncbi:MAG: hypothetical protein B0W54_11110 [Cellvibrio sp. 79]|nr:MAG: hypothetical protein B0W54_11110 [Cellvibrio sp. 79]
MTRFSPPFLLALLCIISIPVFSADSIFNFTENQVISSPNSTTQLELARGESVIDFDVSPLKPLAATVIKTAQGTQTIFFWDINDTNPSRENSWQIPEDVGIQSIAFHPQGNSLFLLTKKGSQQEIITTPLERWSPKVIYQLNAQLRRLVVGPRPFEIGYDEKTNTTPTAYRLFFGVKNTDGKYSTHSITETGTREYVALGSNPHPAAMNDTDFPPPPKLKLPQHYLLASIPPGIS